MKDFEPIHPDTRVGQVHLKVSDLERSIAFYREALGLQVTQRMADAAAFLDPSREALAHAYRRLMKAGVPLDGAADHGVSEALYLRDPDGNGLELYRDRAEADWPRNADGSLAMFTRALDLNALAAVAE